MYEKKNWGLRIPPCSTLNIISGFIFNNIIKNTFLTMKRMGEYSMQLSIFQGFDPTINHFNNMTGKYFQGNRKVTA